MSKATLGECLRSLPAEGLALLRSAASLARVRWAWLLAGLLLIASGALWLFPRDAALLSALTHDRSGAQKDWGQQLSFWGDYLPGTVLWCACLWFAGYWRGCIRWRRAALSALLAASLAGSLAVVARTTVGRPRPVANVPDGFYGLRRDASYHGFPSGHSTTSVATATALAIAGPAWIGLPAIAGAGGVLWSRMMLRQHHPADVWTGAGLGLLAGILFAAAARATSPPAHAKPSR